MRFRRRLRNVAQVCLSMGGAPGPRYLASTPTTSVLERNSVLRGSEIRVLHSDSSPVTPEVAEPIINRTTIPFRLYRIEVMGAPNVCILREDMESFDLRSPI